MAEHVRQPDSKQCQEEPLGGPRLAVLPPFCRPGRRCSSQRPPVGTYPCRLLSLSILCLCFLASQNAFPPTSSCPHLHSLAHTPPSPGCLPRPPRVDTLKLFRSLVSLPTLRISVQGPPRVVFCLCIDTPGVYILSPNWNRFAVPSSCLQTSQFPHLEGGDCDFLFNEKIEAWRRQEICPGHSGKVAQVFQCTISQNFTRALLKNVLLTF